MQSSPLPSQLQAPENGTHALTWVEDSGVEGKHIPPQGRLPNERIKGAWTTYGQVLSPVSIRDIISVFRKGLVRGLRQRSGLPSQCCSLLEALVTEGQGSTRTRNLGLSG